MLELLNRYAHGFVAIPIISVCINRGLLKLLKSKAYTQIQLVDKLKANSGYLNIALRMLLDLNWIEEKDNLYVINARGLIGSNIPLEIINLYHINFNQYLFNAESDLSLLNFLNTSFEKWGFEEQSIADFFDGALLTPILINIAIANINNSVEYFNESVLPSFNKTASTELIPYLINKGWLEDSEHGFKCSAIGKFFIERSLNMAVTASYHPLIIKYEELLFGNPKNVLAYDQNGHEMYVDRTLNVIGSGFQHDKFFHDVDDIIISIFNQTDLEQQPRYIADMGCGDGSLLKRIYTTILNKTYRGKNLQAYPFTIIGIDYNVKALQAAYETLKDIPHLLIRGDISDPSALHDSLHNAGITNLDEILHIRSFLDHDRIYSEPNDEKGLLAKANYKLASQYVDQDGNIREGYKVLQNLVEHFTRWRSIIGHHGIIILEVHSLITQIIQKYFDTIENFHFDTYHSLSKQMLIGSEYFLQALAEAGLYSLPEFTKKYPKTFPFARITIQYYKKQDFFIRTASQEDLESLLKLEQLCWEPHLRLTARTILKRIENYSEGQFVVLKDNELVGVLYTQRIAEIDELYKTDFNDLPLRHIDNGSCLQLLSMNVHPDFQQLGLGSQLINFIHEYACFKANCELIVGVTRCKNYSTQQLPYEEYVYKTDDFGLPVDPVLKFHCSHGAKIVGLIKGFRADDIENNACGILIVYDINRQVESKNNCIDIKYLSENAINVDEIIETSVREVKGKKLTHYSSQLAFKDLGFDSLDLVELKNCLMKKFKLDLEVSFFFSYPTPELVASAISKQLGRSRNSAIDFKQHQSENQLDLKNNDQEDIAIIGYSNNFAGETDTPDKFWQLLKNGQSVIQTRAKNRWSEFEDDLKNLPASLQYINKAAFLKDIDFFDHSFFNISPLEAEFLDPQQRILLQQVWEAFERSGIVPSSLKGSQTGVFLGIHTHDYESLINSAMKPTELNHYYATGNSSSIAAGRIAYAFDFCGPTLAIDTACSSSLVALHLACQSLFHNESTLAVVAGINLMITPYLSLSFAQANMLSPDGLCKTFDASANGYVRGEGAAVVILKRLSQALEDNNTIYGIIKGTAINQDGASNGLTAPNLIAQKNVIRTALRNSNVEASSITYVEAHGTGTALGDPIEVEAISEIYANRAKGVQFALGSVKTNIGHTESVAGLAGLIKVLMSFEHEFIPPHQHLNQLNSAIELPESCVIPTKGLSWRREENLPRMAGVSSFGFSGTNAHIILEEPPLCKNLQASDEEKYYIIAISAKSEIALKGYLDKYQTYIKNDHSSLKELAYTSTVGRQHFGQRIAFIVDTIDDLSRQLLNMQQNWATYYNPKFDKDPQIALIFNKELKICRGIYNTLILNDRVFNNHCKKYALLIEKYTAININDLLDTGISDSTSLEEYSIVLAFYFEYCVATYLQSCGMQPILLIGSGIGEYVAACYAEMFNFEDGIKLVFNAQRLIMKKIESNEFLELLESLNFSKPKIEFISELSHLLLTKPYNIKNLIQIINSPPAKTVTVSQLSKNAIDLNIEIGCRGDVNFENTDASILTIDLSCQKQIKLALARLYCIGVEVDWKKNHLNTQRFLLNAPTYPFEKNKFWVKAAKTISNVSDLVIQTSSMTHPLLGYKLNTPLHQFQSTINLVSFPYFKDHAIGENIIFPASAYVEMILAVCKHISLDPIHTHVSIELHQALILPVNNDIRIQVSLSMIENERYEYQVHSNSFKDTKWVFHASGVCITNQKSSVNYKLLKEIQESINISILIDDFYNNMNLFGYNYGESFRGITQLYKNINNNEFLAKIKLPTSVKNDLFYISHPCILDACFQIGLIGLLGQQDIDYILIPIAAGNIQINNTLPTTIWCHAMRLAESNEFDYHLYDELGIFLGHIKKFSFKQLKSASLLAFNHLDQQIPFYYQPYWERIENDMLLGKIQKGKWLIFADSQGMATQFANMIENKGGQCALIYLDLENDNSLDPFREFNLLRNNPQSTLKQVNNLHSRFDHSIFFWPLDVGLSDKIANETILEVCLTIIQEISALTINLSEKIYIISKSSQPDFEDIEFPELASLWGLALAANAEMLIPKIQLIDLPVDFTSVEQQQLIMACESDHDTLAIRNNILYKKLIKPLNYQNSTSPVLTKINKQAAYLIIGGTGALGKLLAKFLCSLGLENIIITSRNPDAHNLEWITEYNIDKQRIMVYKLDVINLSEIKDLIHTISHKFTIKGIIHAAGVLKDAVLANQSWDNFSYVYAPKVIGAKNIITVISNLQLDFIWFFSSLTAVFGMPGQINYASANAVLDSLAAQLRKLNYPALSINWGPWSGEGMAANYEENLREHIFSDAIHPAQANALFPQLMNVSASQILVSPLKTNLIANSMRRTIPSILRSIAEQAPQISYMSEVKANFDKIITASHPEDYEEVIIDFLKKIVNEILGKKPQIEISSTLPLSEIGLDSFMAITLKTKLEGCLNQAISTTLLFNYPTLKALANYIIEKLSLHIDNKIVSDEISSRHNEIDEIENLSEEDLRQLLGENYATEE